MVLRSVQSGIALATASTLDQAVIFSATDVRGIITEANDNFCALSGYTRDELIGQTHRIIKSGLHDKALFRAMHRTIARGQLWRGELCNRAKDGRLYWVDCSIVPLIGVTGKVIGYSSVRIDITARKQTEATLRANETLLRSTLMALSEGVVVQDAHGRIVSCNPAAQQILGLGESEIIGASSLDPKERAIHENGEDFPGDQHPAMVALRTGEPQHAVMMGLRRDDGAVTWISINSQPIGEAGAAPTAVVTSFSDVTARKLAQETLIEAVNAMPDGFVVYDRNDRLVICNDAYRQIYPTSAPAIVPGATFADLIRYGVARGQYPQAGTSDEEREAWIADRLHRHNNPSADIIQKIDDGRWLQIRERRTPSGYLVGFRTDVTRLTLEAAKLRALLDNFPGGLVMIEPDGRLSAWNDNFRSLLDLPAELFARDRLTTEDIVRFNAARGEYGPDLEEEKIQAYLAHIRRGEAYAIERVRADGKVLDVRGTPLAGGGFVIAFSDITERHEATARLQASEERARAQHDLLQHTLACMRQGLTMFDADGRLLVWNARYAQIYGLPAEAVRSGVHISELLRLRREAGTFHDSIDG